MNNEVNKNKIVVRFLSRNNCQQSNYVLNHVKKKKNINTTPTFDIAVCICTGLFLSRGLPPFHFLFLCSYLPELSSFALVTKRTRSILDRAKKRMVQLKHLVNNTSASVVCRAAINRCVEGR